MNLRVRVDDDEENIVASTSSSKRFKTSALLNRSENVKHHLSFFVTNYTDKFFRVDDDDEEDIVRSTTFSKGSKTSARFKTGKEN